MLDIHTCFAAALKVAKECNPARTPPTGTRKRLRQTHAYNLITRHSENRGGVLRFLTDLRALRSGGRQFRQHPLLPLHLAQAVRRYLQVPDTDLPGQSAYAATGS